MSDENHRINEKAKSVENLTLDLGIYCVEAEFEEAIYYRIRLLKLS